MSELLSLPNVGKVLEKLLLKSGITSVEQLREMGAQQAFLRIREQNPTACLHMFYGLEGAVQGVPDKLLDQAAKDRLKHFYHSL